MQISMEILSPKTGQADSAGANKRYILPINVPTPSFRKIMEVVPPANTRPVYEPKSKTENFIPGETQYETYKPKVLREQEEDDTETTGKTDNDDEDIIAESLAAGVTGNQQMVVSILEGDKESATITDVTINTGSQGRQPTEDVTQVGLSDTDDVPEAEKPAADTEAAQVRTYAQVEQGVIESTAVNNKANEAIAANSGAENAEVYQAPVIEAQAAENTPEADSKVKADTTVRTEKIDAKADADDESGSDIGEVMARTPEIRTSEQNGDEENSSDLSDNDGLSPLENENDPAPAKGAKDKSYSAAEDAARNKTGSAVHAANSTPPPLTGGITPERFQADQQMSQVTAGLPVQKENLFDEMVSRIETMQTDSKSAMTIQLKPEFLGKVALEIAVDAAGLHVKINAEDSGVRSMINSEMAKLIESLENKGIAVVDVEVAWTGVNNGMLKDTREGHANMQQDQSRKSSRRNNDYTDNAVYYAALPLDVPGYGYFYDDEVSSVEYRA